MHSLFTVPTHATAGAYAFFYQAVFVAAGFLIFHEGYRRKWPMLPWLIVMTACVVCAILGSKLVLLSGYELSSFLLAGRLPHTLPKTYLGGVVGGVIGACLARRLVGFRYSVLDAFAIALPLAHTFGRVGCLLSGCCFGAPASLPWGITYESGSVPYFAQLSEGLIAANAATSLPVHPTQLYESIFCLALALLVWKQRGFWRAPGSLFYSQAITYCLFRFLVEFVRHGGNTIGGLKQVQWILLLASICLAIIVIYKEKRWKLHAHNLNMAVPALFPNLLAVVSLVLLLRLRENWFTPLEMSVLNIFSFALLALASVQTIRAFSKLRLRWVYCGMAALSPALLIIMPQAQVPQDTVKSDYATFSIGGMTGQYEESCGPTHSYNVGGIGIVGTHHYSQHQKLTYGLRGYFGTDKENAENGRKFSLRVVNPYLQYDTRYVGIGIGGHAGDLIFGGADDEHLYPGALLRLGPYNKFFVEGKLANHFPGSFPAPLLKLGIGIGLQNEGSIRLGISDAGFYVNPYLTTQSGLVIDPFLGFGNGQNHQFGLTFHYRFRH